MKKQNKLEWIYKIVGVIILLVCLGIVGIFALNTPGFIISLANSFAKLPATLQAGTLTGFIVILGWFVNSYFARRNEEKRAFENNVRPKKIEIYDDFIKFIVRQNLSYGTNDQISPEEMIDFFKKTTPMIMSYSSAKVIRKWGEWRVYVANHTDDTDSKDIIWKMEAVIFEMRRDLGHREKMRQGDVLRLIVNDIDDELEKIKNKE